MSWEIGVSTGTFYPFKTMEEALGLIADEGFGVAELFVQTPSEYTIIYGRRVLRMLLRNGLRIHSIHVNSNDLEVAVNVSFSRKHTENTEPRGPNANWLVWQRLLQLFGVIRANE